MTTEDEKFKQEVLVALAEIKIHMVSTKKECISNHEDIIALKKTVNGNGQIGLSERVRVIEKTQEEQRAAMFRWIGYAFAGASACATAFSAWVKIGGNK